MKRDLNTNQGLAMIMNPTGQIPLPSKNFQTIIKFYLFECPVRTRTPIPKKKRDSNDPQAKYKCNFKKVSKRGVTFEDRGIDGAKLNSLRAAMMRITNVKLAAVETEDEVIRMATAFAENEYIVIKRNEQNTSVTEGYFYCIRNAFAHGDFDVVGKTYILRNESKGEIKGLARVKEHSLLAWINLIEMDIEKIKSIGKAKNIAVDKSK